MNRLRIRRSRGRQDRAREGDPAADALAALRGGGAGLARRGARGAEVAAKLGIPRSYGSYEELLADPEIDAVYNPLPNHLHVPWTIKAAEAGKHVLCEKPIGLDAAECAQLIAVRDRTGVRIQEAFMVRTHPQWLQARELVRGGRIGELKAIHGHFSYHLTDPTNVRNVAEWGGGGLLDIGCYPITTSRFVTGLEPQRVAAIIERDPASGIDRLGTALLDYGPVQCCFQYGTQIVPRQTMQFFGTKARLVVEIGFNAPNDVPCRLTLYEGPGLGDVVAETIEHPRLRPVRHHGRRLRRQRSRTARRSPCRWRTASPTCG